ncbi:SAP domain-containing protein [Plectosphaerella cucumerina]|uniref:SAP domain-containing protein n=1 Tax=Plectosphaerella cucumerina TaxID=40658 RepID=A0A8K0TPQ5_9PEZI|nr:SAP domain-containing protein [Plectosphaerella cucumerina]
MTNWGRLKVGDLRAELRNRGLQHSGLKQELVQRLLDDDLKQSREETEEQQVRGPSPATHTTDVEGSVAFEKEARGVTGIDQVAEPTAQPSLPDDTSKEDDLDQSQKRKRRSATPLPDPKRCKANALSTPGRASSPNSHVVVDTAPSVSTSDAADGYTTTHGQLQGGNSAKDTSNVEPATTKSASALVPATVTDSHEERLMPAMAGEEVPATDPALHPTTRALYIRELMRPLRDEDFRAHLVKVSTSTQQDGESTSSIEVFFVDRIRTHAFVVFSDTAMAVRARAALHNVVWPQECNRKPLWVDFVPAEKVTGWIMEESAEGRGTAKRWQVRYGRDDDGNAQVFFSADTMPTRLETETRSHLQFTHQHPPSARMSDNANSIPLGPRRARSGWGNGVPWGTPGSPLGPKPDRLAHPAPDHSDGRHKVTRTEPSISYQRVAEDVASRRVMAIRSHYTLDVDRKLGNDDEINRYTFECEDMLVDRGKENFVGIRPPHREARRNVQGGSQQSRQPRNSPPRHMPRQARGPGPLDGRYPPDTIGISARRRFGQDQRVASFATSANEIPISTSHRFRRRD